MNAEIREQLIGYMLGALEEGEHRHVEEKLNSDPLWQRELAAVQQSLEPLAEVYQEHEPPPQLAERTCAYVADESERLRVTRPGRAWTAGEAGFNSRRHGSLADWIVMAGVCLVAISLFFPALLNSRFTSQVAACQNNFRELGIALTEFSEATREHFFPSIPATGNRAFAGFYAPALLESGLLPNARRVICPASVICREWAQFRVPSVHEIDTACGERLLALQTRAGGSYAYSLGFVLNGQLVTPRNLGRGHYILMADAPSVRWNRLSVHGRGFNVLFEDGHVQFLCEDQCDHSMHVDHPFTNRWGRMEAGTDIDDAVVAESYQPPLLHTISYARP